MVGAFFLSLAYAEMLYTLVALAVGLQKVSMVSPVVVRRATNGETQGDAVLPDEAASGRPLFQHPAVLSCLTPHARRPDGRQIVAER